MPQEQGRAAAPFPKNKETMRICSAGPTHQSHGQPRPGERLRCSRGCRGRNLLHVVAGCPPLPLFPIPEYKHTRPYDNQNPVKDYRSPSGRDDDGEPGAIAAPK